MRRWWTHSLVAAGHVADRPALWLPGALAWTATVGWIAFLVGVARAPSVAELTFAGARIVSSGAWPWNALGLGLASLTIGAALWAVAATGESALLRGRQVTLRDVGRFVIVGVVCGVPAVIGGVILLGALFVVAPGEFNAPETSGGPILRTVLRVSPIIAGIAVAIAGGAAMHAAAIRGLAAGRSVDQALRAAPSMLAGAGVGAGLQAAFAFVTRLAYLAVAAILLRVLWAPIGEQLDASGMDAAVALLLVGFVAIWLCLVLGGGALHAWGSVSWTRVLDRTPGRET